MKKVVLISFRRQTAKDPFKPRQFQKDVFIAAMVASAHRSFSVGYWGSQSGTPCCC